MPDGWRPSGWLMVHSAASGPVFAHGTLEGEAEAALRKALDRSRGALAPQLLDRAIENIAAVGAARRFGDMSVLAVSDAHALVRDFLETMLSLPEAPELVDFPRRIEHALSNGVPMDVDDLKYLYDLELRTWAPTSERSRSQAGYGVY